MLDLGGVPGAPGTPEYYEYWPFDPAYPYPNGPAGVDPLHPYGSTVDEAWRAFGTNLDAGIGTGAPGLDTVSAALEATAVEVLATAFYTKDVQPWLARVFLDSGMPATGDTAPVEEALTEIAAIETLPVHASAEGHLPPAPATPAAAVLPAAQEYPPSDAATPLRPPRRTSRLRAAAEALGEAPRTAPGEPSATPRKRARDTVADPQPPDKRRRRSRTREEEEWVLSAALSPDSVRAILETVAVSGGPVQAGEKTWEKAIIKLGQKLGFSGSANEVRKQMRAACGNGLLRDPGVYRSAPPPKRAARPDPLGTPEGAVGQWLLDSILNGLTVQQICDRAAEEGTEFPTTRGGCTRQVLRLGHALGATGTAGTIMQTLRDWRDAGLLVRAAGRWTVAEG
ncbi:hypothetical protein ACFQ78_33575 [Streptomyces sp. NPDC056519]|uniref:hypothetical protein n=1 Tax=Streptomyces sp. NPDC056519 TaxID=3345849 RepID=UPI0036C78E7F